MRVVLDAGPIIHLSWIDHLHLLPALFDEILLPPAVRDEVLAAPQGTLGLKQIHAALNDGVLRVRPLAQAAYQLGQSPSLDRGESEALLLAEEAGADLLITDDAEARAMAARHGIIVTGTLGVLRAARGEGLIPAALPLVLELRRLGQWVSPALIARIRTEETPGEPDAPS